MNSYNDLLNAAHNYNLTLLNYNVRSFSSNGDSFCAFLANLVKMPDFIVLTETWVSPVTEPLCVIDGYTVVHTFRNNIRGGGVSIFHDNRIF